MLHDLYTSLGETISKTPWDVYPRPQMKRDSWLNLNGEWNFSTNYGEPETVTTKRLVSDATDAEILPSKWDISISSSTFLRRMELFSSSVNTVARLEAEDRLLYTVAEEL